MPPSHFHVVLITRTEPSLPLAGLRAQNLLEIDSWALRFDLEETRRFIEHEGLEPLDPAELKLLHERTEGWSAALRIVASTSSQSCLLYTSDAADERSSVDLGGRRIIK